MKKLVLGLTAAIAVAALPVAYSASFAQAPQAQRMQNVSFHTVEFIKFKEGKRERAGEMVEKYFVPAATASKTPEPVEYHLDSGEWDYVLFWPLKGGLSDLEWQTTPDDIAWMKSLATVAGGEPQAKALMEEWNGLINRRVRAVAHHHKPAR
jgi:hypothetical protein